jgi:protein required for attachment to host cells
MADRNPFIPSERRQDVEHHSHAKETESHQRFAEQQAKLKQDATDVGGELAEEAKEKVVEEKEEEKAVEPND